TQEAGGKEIGQRSLDVLEAQHVRDVTRPLDREHEIAGRIGRPLRECLRALQRVKCAVDLDAVENDRGIGQLAAVQQSFRIEPSAPGRIGPPGNADAHSPSHHKLKRAGRPRVPLGGEALGHLGANAGGGFWSPGFGSCWWASTSYQVKYIGNDQY